MELMVNIVDYAFLDLEGTLFNPKFDNAHLVHHNLVSPETRKRFLRNISGPDRDVPTVRTEDLIIDIFDEWDDDADRDGRDEPNGHHTGTTPLMVLLEAALDNIDTPRLCRYQIQGMTINPNADKFVRFLTYEKGVNVTFVTNAYPAAALKFAQEMGVPWKRVYTLGYLPDDLPALKRDDIEYEAIARWPQELLMTYKNEVLKFLETVLTRVEMLPYPSPRVFASAFDKITDRTTVDKKLRKFLDYAFVQERAIRGGRNKAEIVDRVARGQKALRMGDSIVDWAFVDDEYGITINCTNWDAMERCGINVATTDWELLIPLADDIIEGSFKPEFVNSYRTDGLAVFGREEIKEQMPQFKEKKGPIYAANNDAKAYLKKLYRPPKVA